MDPLKIAIWVLIGLSVLQAIGIVFLVDKPREPITEGDAAFRIALSLVLITVYVVILSRLP